jgi:hypothetical protein
MPLGIAPTMLGFRVSGDLDGLTLYTNRRGRTVAFAKSPPQKPPTASQLAARARFAAAMQAWRDLTPVQRDFYLRACDLASLCMIGQNLFLSMCLTGVEPRFSELCDALDFYPPPPPEL